MRPAVRNGWFLFGAEGRVGTRAVGAIHAVGLDGYCLAGETGCKSIGFTWRVLAPPVCRTGSARIPALVLRILYIVPNLRH